MASVLLLTILLGAPVEAHRPGPADIRTQADLDALVAQLDDPQSRLAAVARLIEFCELRPWVANLGTTTGDPQRDALVDAAYDVVVRAMDAETVGMMIASSNDDYQFHGLLYFPDESSADERGPLPHNLDKWRALLPRVRQLAATGDRIARGPAQEVLRGWGGEREFLMSLVPTETEAANLMRLVHPARLNPHLLRLLHHPDDEIRRNALIFIGGNSRRAPMWQVSFSDAVVARVFELSQSTDDDERQRAAYALVELRGRNPDAVRERLFELADDPYHRVRWCVAGGLKDQTDRPDVQAVLRRLLKDESVRVRYHAIVVLGPENCIPELREMAVGADPQYARNAQWQLEKIGAAEDEAAE